MIWKEDNDLSDIDINLSLQTWSDQTQLSLLHEQKFYKFCCQGCHRSCKAWVETSATSNYVYMPVIVRQSQTSVAKGDLANIVSVIRMWLINDRGGQLCDTSPGQLCDTSPGQLCDTSPGQLCDTSPMWCKLWYWMHIASQASASSAARK